MLHTILKAYGLNPDLCRAESFGSGLINNTWKVSGADKEFILQRINKDVFKKPEDIASNIELIDGYLASIAPKYLFAAPLRTTSGELMVRINEDYYRLLPFIPDSHTVDFLTDNGEAYEAARQFARFTRLLQDFDVTQLHYTLPDFHNLKLRIAQFREAERRADANRLKEAALAIKQVHSQAAIADVYSQIVEQQAIPLRVIHHDTKINNVLFDEAGKGLCVIDLDTVMPGYFISDVGDMMRTYLAEANEEELDADKIVVRPGFFAAIYAGYLEEMCDILTPAEKALFIYSGKFMIYMQAVRFLADYLNGDSYYATQYPGHNLSRAMNQLQLLKGYTEAEPVFNEIIKKFSNQPEIYR